VPRLDDLQWPPIEWQDVGLVLLGVGRLPGEHPPLGVEVRPCGASQLLLAGAAEIDNRSVAVWVVPSAGAIPHDTLFLREDLSPITSSMDLLDWLAPRVAKWWLPDDVIFLDTLPKTSVGKVAERELRERFVGHRWPAT